MRVCLLTGSELISDWMSGALEHMIQNTDADIEMVVIVEEPTENTTSEPTLQQVPIMSRIIMTYKNFTNRNPSEYIAISDLSYLSESKTVTCEQINLNGVGVEIPDNVVNQINETCDVVIHSGVGILKGEIINATRHGILGFHHGDFRSYRGGPAGFWEFMHDCPRSGVTVQILREELDAGYVVEYKEVDISEKLTWESVRDKLYQSSIPMLTEAINNITQSDFEPEIIPSNELGEIYYMSEFTLRIRILSRWKELKNILHSWITN